MWEEVQRLFVKEKIKPSTWMQQSFTLEIISGF